MSQQERGLALLHAAHRLVSQRNDMIPFIQSPGLRGTWLKSGDYQLMTGGACGSYAHVLGRLFSEAEIEYRIMQMLCKPEAKGACHILTDAKIDGKWVVFDPLYNLAYRTPSGELAGFDELNENWDYYSEQTPARYKSTYDFSGRRYTNWQKIPITMPLIHQGLKLGGQNFISVRAYVLNLYFTYAYLVLIAQIGLGILSFYILKIW